MTEGGANEQRIQDCQVHRRMVLYHRSGRALGLGSCCVWIAGSASLARNRVLASARMGLSYKLNFRQLGINMSKISLFSISIFA